MAHGRDRALCVVREVPGAPDADPRDGVRNAGRGATARREFFGLLKSQVSNALLRQTQLALCVIHIDGLEAIGRVFDFSLVEHSLTQLLARLPADEAAAGGCQWSVAVIGDNLLAAILEQYGDRDHIRAAVGRLQASLAAPLAVGSATFNLTPRAGIAVLGEDATRARALLEHAHSAMLEARRSAGQSVSFYSDTLRLRTLTRTDIEQELRDAIEADQLALRYLGRHDLRCGDLIAVQAYMTWPHPLRGEVKAAEFLPVAESTGLAAALSRWALQRLRRDLPALRSLVGSDAKISFGPLRHHLADNLLAADIQELLQSGELAPGALELRIAEKVLGNLGAPGTTLRALAEQGVAIVIDEFGRGSTSLTKLARLPIHALQLDRALVLSAASDPIAFKAMRGAIAVATALDMLPIAAGVDDPAQRDRLCSLGCIQGMGDCFDSLSLQTEPIWETARAPGARPSGRVPI